MKNWILMDHLLIQLPQENQSELETETLFEVFEKYPTETGDGVFWTILDRLEATNYQKYLFKSLLKKNLLIWD